MYDNTNAKNVLNRKDLTIPSTKTSGGGNEMCAARAAFSGSCELARDNYTNNQLILFVISP